MSDETTLEPGNIEGQSGEGPVTTTQLEAGNIEGQSNSQTGGRGGLQYIPVS